MNNNKTISNFYSRNRYWKCHNENGGRKPQRIKCITTKQFFSSVSEASKQTNISASSIYRAIQQEISVNGLNFTYV